MFVNNRALVKAHDGTNWELNDNEMTQIGGIRRIHRNDLRTALLEIEKKKYASVDFYYGTAKAPGSRLRIISKGYGSFEIGNQWLFSARRMKKIRQWVRVYTVSVTAEDIQQGQQNVGKGGVRSMSCAVVLSLRRQFGLPCTWGYTCGGVKKFTLRVLPGQQNLVWKFVTDHDGLKEVEPFQFEAEQICLSR